MTDEMTKRIMAYAKAIIGNQKISENQDETLKRIVINNPEIVFESLGIEFEKHEKDLNSEGRLMKYYELISNKSINSENIKHTKRMLVYKKQMESIIRSYAKYDYSKEGKIEVNGNTFTYNVDSFEPSKYMDELAKMGEISKGDIFSASEDEEGKLVIY